MRDLFTLCSLAIALTLGSVQAAGQFLWTKDVHNPVVTGGAPGSWNYFVDQPWVLFNADSARYELWFVGFNSDRPGRIGFASSKDGINWTMYPSPVLSPDPGKWDSYSVEMPRVIRENGGYKMWYAGGPSWTFVPCYIGYATSPDGIQWTRYPGNPVMAPGSSAWEGGGVYVPAIMPVSAGYRMWYCGYDVSVSKGQIGYAFSTDGLAWTRDTANNPVCRNGDAGQWDDAWVNIPNVLKIGSTYYLWYMGQRANSNSMSVGVATSQDSGVSWTKYAANPVMAPSAGTWDANATQIGAVLQRGDTLEMWYSGGSPWKIGHALSVLVHPGVRRRVPQDFATIQAAIDASNNGDTVLVSEGTYLENIRYRGKAIVVASLYAIDNDTTHIAKTIIDGSGSTHPDSGSVVFLIDGEDTTSVLCGFTIQGGTGTRMRYTGTGGPLWERTGGGVFSFGAGARITRNIITRNRIVAGVSSGAGVHCVSPYSGLLHVILEGNSIKGNYVEGDVGVVGAGAAFAGVDVRVVGNVFEEDSAVGIVSAGGGGGGLSFWAWDTGVRWPNGYIAGNVFRSNNVKAAQQIAGGGGLLLRWTGEVTVQGNLFESNTATSIGGSGFAQGGGICVLDEDISGYGRKGYGRKMIVNNRFLNNSVHCAASNDGGGVTLYKTLATLRGNYFAENAVEEVSSGAGGGAGISLLSSSFRIENSIFARNSSAVGAGGLTVNGLPEVGSEQLIINNTVVGNLGRNVGGLAAVNASNLVLLNNIFWNDSSLYGDPEIAVSGSIAGIAYCDVKYGYPGTGNIDIDPAFVVGDSMLNLKPSSPCIGRGIDSIQITGVWYHSPMCDCDNMKRPMPVGTHPDIGAQEEQTVVVGVAEQPALPLSYALCQNYPNPFNPTTTIKFELPNSSVVRLSVYDILGREVSVLVNEKRDTGYHQVRFDGSNLASGVYLYRMQAGDFVQTRRLLLLR